MKAENGSILVLLYNKNPRESKTCQALATSKLDLTGVNLCLWNNGPFPIESEEVKFLAHKFKTVDLVQTIDNIAISRVYNRFIYKFPSNFYIFLDDDSTITNNYLEHALKTEINQVSVPILTHNGVPQSPKSNSQVITSNNMIFDKRFRASGSGIVVGKDVAKKVKDKFDNIFDERFYFYGVDTTFFIRLEMAKLNNRLTIIPGFEHSWSSSENEGPVMSAFRVKERSYCEGLRVRYYKRWLSRQIYIAKAFLRHKKGDDKNGRNYAYILDAIISGKHYRDENKA